MWVWMSTTRESEKAMARFLNARDGVCYSDVGGWKERCLGNCQSISRPLEVVM